jgi:kynurenine/2-aminoadipate aminotransferase
MFVWIDLLNVKDSTGLIQNEAREKKVLMVPGGAFLPAGGDSSCVRAAFSVATPEQLDEAMRRFAECLAEFHAKHN